MGFWGETPPLLFRMFDLSAVKNEQHGAGRAEAHGRL